MRRGATAKARINRKDFGMSFNVALEAGGFLVGEDVDISLDVEKNAGGGRLGKHTCPHEPRARMRPGECPRWCAPLFLGSLPLQFLGYALRVELAYFERPLQRDGLGQVAFLVVTGLVAEGTFDRKRAVRPQRRRYLGIEADRDVAHDPDVSVVDRNGLLDHR